MSGLESGMEESTLGKTCIELEDRIDVLLATSSAPDMDVAAREIRLTALEVRRLLMRAPLSAPLFKLRASVPDQRQLRVELADLAVDIVAAVDYLLSLLTASATRSVQFILGDEAGPNLGHSSSNDAAIDRLIRRRLDARGGVVRLVMRLVAGLRADFPTSS